MDRDICEMVEHFLIYVHPHKFLYASRHYHMCLLWVSDALGVVEDFSEKGYLLYRNMYG